MIYFDSTHPLASFIPDCPKPRPGAALRGGFFVSVLIPNRGDLSPANSSMGGSITRRGMDMKARRFTEEQIIGILREQEAGAKWLRLCSLVRR
jgi:hypothetical protein